MSKKMFSTDHEMTEDEELVADAMREEDVDVVSADELTQMFGGE